MINDFSLSFKNKEREESGVLYFFLSERRKGRLIRGSDFVTSASCIPDAKESVKTQNNSWHASRTMQRTINRFKDFSVEHPVRVISVAVVKNANLILSLFYALNI